jgi:hypothetical protein
MLRLCVIIGLAGLLSACATPTPYQSAEPGGFGYSQQQIEDNRFNVSFRGNTLTDRETVETYLLLRAAELTLERGADHFMLVRRDTDTDRRFVGTGDRFRSHYGFGYRYFHPRHGWHGWRDPFWDDVHVREVTRFEATAEIVLARGESPGGPDAFDARQVVANLGPVARAPRS